MKKRQRDGEKVDLLRLHESMEEWLGQIQGVSINLSDTQEAVGQRVGLLARTMLRLAETKDWTPRVESDVTDLRATMANAVNWRSRITSCLHVRPMTLSYRP